MPVDLKIPGSPDSIRASARWLRQQLATAVNTAADRVYDARNESEGAWKGDAGTAFRARMTTGGAKADQLGQDIDTAGQSFEAYADQLATAQAGMARARSIATAAGLRVENDVVYEPQPPVAGSLPPTATPDQVAIYRADLAAQEQAWGLLAKAFNDVVQEATHAFGLLDVAADIFQRSVNDIADKPVLAAADFFNDGMLPAVAARYQPKLTATARKLMAEHMDAVDLYGRMPPLFPGIEDQLAEVKAKSAAAGSALDRAEKFGKEAVEERAAKAGIVLTGVGIGWDVAHGKPPGEAVISGVGGAAIGGLVGGWAAGAVEGAIEGSVAGPAGAVVGGLVGVVAGTAAGSALDWGYEHLPKGVRDAIEGGTGYVSGVIGGAGTGLKGAVDTTRDLVGGLGHVGGF